MTTRHIAVLGDVHGHLQLALSVCARWQRQLGLKWDAVCLCGDVGTFTSTDQLDSATRSHARADPGELEFLTQWATAPQAPWLAWIFKPLSDGGLGLDCPVVMTHGNHEGFEHLSKLQSRQRGRPDEPVGVGRLPGVDSGRRIRWLPSGWRLALPGKVVIGAIGGIEPDQRNADYPPLAFIDDEAVEHFASLPPGSLDLLITHQGPAALQGADLGSETLDLLLDAGVAPVWCHGHAAPVAEMTTLSNTRVVPLRDIHKLHKDTQSGWLHIEITEGEESILTHAPPQGLRDFMPHLWPVRDDGLLISPDLKHLKWQFRNWRAGK